MTVAQRQVIIGLYVKLNNCTTALSTKGDDPVQAKKIMTTVVRPKCECKNEVKTIYQAASTPKAPSSLSSKNMIEQLKFCEDNLKFDQMSSKETTSIL